MADRPTDKCRCPSQFSPGKWVTPAQWLAERVTARQYRRRHKGDPPDRFWEFPEWAGVFRQQLKLAAGLLRQFALAAVGNALRTPRGAQVWSLGAPWFSALCREEDRKLRRAAALPPPPPAPPPGAAPPPPLPPGTARPAFVQQKSLLSRLKGL